MPGRLLTSFCGLRGRSCERVREGRLAASFRAETDAGRASTRRYCFDSAVQCWSMEVLHSEERVSITFDTIP